jgi:hypothetical protein
VKLLVLTNTHKRILFLSNAYHGSCHDYRMLKEEFDPNQGAWFDEHNLWVDLGFLGIQKDYDEKILIPAKKSKKRPLSEIQKYTNRCSSQIRIKVEHAIGGIKRFRILSDRLRMKSVIRYNQVAGICAGIWNFQLTCSLS